MNVAIIGTGYVGLVTGAGLASVGNDVTCIDSDPEKIAALKSGHIPFHEPGLPELVAGAQAAGCLHFTTGLDEACLTATVIVLAVGTPSNGKGEADLSSLEHCAQHLADTLRHRCVVVIKSTVPPGTCEAVQALFDSRHPSGRSEIRVASNPEFLAEGSAVEDFCRPPRIVIGVDEPETGDILEQLYAPFDPDGDRLFVLDVCTAQYAKYACNAMLAARISMVNELANIGAACGADVQSVFRVVGADPRIGHRYLHPGPGFGGSCLPKDVRALRSIASLHGEPAPLLKCVELINTQQLDRVAEAVAGFFPDGLAGRHVAIWGLSFKPGTDDIRESPALGLIDRLLDAGAWVRAYDPAVRCFPQMEHSRVAFLADSASACDGADLLCVMTEWPQFRLPDWAEIAGKMSGGAVLDPHLLYDGASLRSWGLQYLGSGNRSMEWTYSGMPFSDSRSRRSSSSSAAP